MSPRMLNGLGGSGDFLRNAKLSIMHTPSAYVRTKLPYLFPLTPLLPLLADQPKRTRQGSAASFPSHHTSTTLVRLSSDQLFLPTLTISPEHDLDIIITEQGLADLRGLSPRERAPVIIEKCAHPDYKVMLHEVRAFVNPR
jgi:acetyl-CoA hydrolase